MLLVIVVPSICVAEPPLGSIVSVSTLDELLKILATSFEPVTFIAYTLIPQSAITKQSACNILFLCLLCFLIAFSPLQDRYF